MENSFSKWFVKREVFDMEDTFLRETIKQLAEKAARLPPIRTQFGMSRPPKIRLTGDLEKDLYALGEVDTTYLDSLYSQMNQTGLFHNNNEVLRQLHTRFKWVMETAKGVPMPKSKIEETLGRVEAVVDQAAEALDHMASEEQNEDLERLYRNLAEFYGGASSVAMAAKEYAMKHFSVKA
jgi:hypothetical protein